MILTILGGIKTLLGTTLGRYLLIAVAAGILLVVAHKIYSNHYWSQGYAACKVDWDKSIANLKGRVDDATDRARDGSVPDPFDRDR